MKDVVSVIVTIDNVESYIATCVDSILKQTYKNMEILLICKATKDNTLKLCKYYKKLDKRIKIIHVSISDNRNLKNIGIDCAKGEYITFVDGGDYVKPIYVEYMVNLIKNNKADIASTDYYILDEKISRKINTKIYNGKSIIANYMQLNISCNFYAKLYKRELFNDIEYPDVTYYDDFMTTYKIFAKASKLVNSSAKNYCLIINKSYFKNRINDYDRMKKIGSCFDMLTFVDEKYPELSSCCKANICFESIDLFREVKDPDYRRQLYSYIKLYRHYALSDERISFNNKMLCIRSVLGYNFMKFSFNIENLLKKPV